MKEEERRQEKSHNEGESVFLYDVVFRLLGFVMAEIYSPEIKE